VAPRRPFSAKVNTNLYSELTIMSTASISTQWVVKELTDKQLKASPEAVYYFVINVI